MKLLYFVLLAAGFVGLALWLLPWWASVCLIVLVVLPLGWFGWKILFGAQIGGEINQEGPAAGSGTGVCSAR